MSRVKIAVRLLLLYVTLGVPWAVSVAAADTLNISGSTTIYPLARELAKSYTREASGYRLQVDAGGSSSGILDLLEYRADIAISSRFLTPEEIASATGADLYLVPFLIGYDAVIPIVHRSNPVKDLTVEQLQAVYSGRITNWRQLGGRDRAIEVLSRKPGSGTRAVWDRRILQDESLAAAVRQLDSTQEMVQRVASSKNTLGYASIGFLSAAIKPVSIDGIMGSSPSSINGEYTLSRPLFLFTRGWPEREILNFIRFSRHPDKGQRILKDFGFIPLY